jgi:hypothetical protein
MDIIKIRPSSPTHTELELKWLVSRLSAGLASPSESRYQVVLVPVGVGVGVGRAWVLGWCIRNGLVSDSVVGKSVWH